MLIYLNQKYLYNGQLLFETVKDQMSAIQFSSMLDYLNRLRPVGYLLFIVFNLLKFLVIAIILNAGIFLSGYKISYSKILRMVIISETVFLLSVAIKFCWLYFFQLNYTYTYLKSFSPLSLLQLVNSNSVTDLWLYPLQVANLFELGYMLVLGAGISRLTNSDYNSALRIVVFTYLPALVTWVLLIMFLLVAFEPSL